MLNFQEYIFNESVGRSLFVYHRTNSDPLKVIHGYNQSQSVQKSGVMYGAGIYACYDLNDQFIPRNISSYGPNIIKYFINTGDFLILDKQISDEPVVDQLRRFRIVNRPQTETRFDIKNILPRLTQMGLEDIRERRPEWVGIIKKWIPFIDKLIITLISGKSYEQLNWSGVSWGHYISQFPGITEDELRPVNLYLQGMGENIKYGHFGIQKFGGQMDKPVINKIFQQAQAFDQGQVIGSVVADSLFHLDKGFNQIPEKVGGILFFGNTDGHVAVIYQPSKIKPVAYALDAVDSNRVKWQKI